MNDFTTDQILMFPHDISLAVHDIAGRIRRDIKNPCFWLIMNGAFMFGADLVRQVPQTQDVQFLHIKRGFGARRPHEPYLIGENPTFLTKYTHVFVDIIAETGTTLQFALSMVPGRQRERAKTVALICKYWEPDYSGYKTDTPDFLSGYGMGPHRQLSYIVRIPQEVK